MKAVIQQGKSQYKIEAGDVILVDKIDAEENSKVEIEKVLLISDNGEVKVGKPYVENAKVLASIVSHGKGDKVINFKYKPKKGYHRTVGHRQPYTELKIDQITV